MTTITNPLVDIGLDDRIHTLSFNNPPNNHFNGEVFEALNAALEEGLGPQSDVLVITGAGRSFSKGFDLGLIRSSKDPVALREHIVALHAVLTRIAEARKPVIAAINGHCFGGGLELALVCHFRLCAEKARLGLPESSSGIIPGLGGVHRLVRAIGEAKALELIALGDMVSAEEALRLNLVNRVFPRDSFTEHVRTFARTLQMLEPDLMQDILKLVRGAAHWTEEENIEAGIKSFVKLAVRLKETP